METAQSNAYSGTAAKDLHDMGYAILGDIMCMKGARAVDDLLRGVVNRCSGLGNHRGSDDPWSKIYNAGESGEEESAERTSDRYTTPRAWICDELETDNSPLHRDKLYLETYIGILVDMLERTCTEYGTGESANNARLSFPRTGSRLLMTTDGCVRQEIPLDYAELPQTAEQFIVRDSPSYVVIASGADPFKLCVWPYTHVMMNCPPPVQQNVLREWPCKVIEVPRFSVIIVRGDLVHAGAGASDDPDSGSPTRLYRQNVRLHMYIVRDNHALLDAVHLPASYKFL